MMIGKHSLVDRLRDRWGKDIRKAGGKSVLYTKWCTPERILTGEILWDDVSVWVKRDYQKDVATMRPSADKYDIISSLLEDFDYAEYSPGELQRELGFSYEKRQRPTICCRRTCESFWACLAPIW